NPEKRSTFELHIRIPGWVTGKPVPGDLYAFKKNQPVNITFLVNEKEVLPEIKNGYAIIKGTWRKGDKVKWNFPMEVRELVAHDAVTQNHEDRKSTRLNSSHVKISYAVFCLKKKMKIQDKH